MFHRLSRLSLAIIVMQALTVPGDALAETHFRRARTRCCLPRHNYGHDTPKFGATEFAVANNLVIGTSRIHKPFHFRATNFEVDHLRLDRVGLAIVRTKERSDARLVATARITHTGGDGGLTGSNVTFRIRAYVGSAPDPVQIPPDSYVVWESEHTLWVPRGQEHITLTPPSRCLRQPEKLAAYFNEITHLEVEMEYRRDR